MGAAEPELQAAGQSTAETLLSSLRTIADPERSKHASVLDYWLSIRGDKEFPPLHDLDPLEISDAGPQSILFELIGGGQDADIRHLGDGLQSHVAVQRLIDAPSPSLLSSIARKLPIVAISRDFLAFEETFSTAAGLTRCWVTLLPLSSCGSWVDYVYAFVTVETSGLGSSAPVAEPAPADPAATTMDEAQAGNADAGVEQAEPEAAAIAAAPETPNQAEDPAAAPDEEKHLGAAIDRQTDLHEPAIGEPAADPETKAGPGFSRLIEGIASLAGFYGQGVKAPDEVSIGHPSPGAEQAEDPDSEAGQPAPSAGEVPLDQVDEAIKRVEPGVEPAEASGDGDKPDADELLASGPIEPDAPPPAENPPGAMVAREAVVAEATAANPAPDETSPPGEEGKLQNKLTEVRARADEAREAQARATRVLHEGLSAAYDFALDAETSPEEYLRLVEAEGMKIQLRAPMAPVASLAFNGLCDEPTIRQFEAVLAWALKQELPRGALIERIEQAGGITELLNGA